MDTRFDLFVETEVPEGRLIVSRTDLKGVITYVNDTFAEISGYEPQELVGRPHSIIRHPDMPRSVFADLWTTIRRGETWRGFVKNLRKDRGYYWVYAEVSGVIRDGKTVEYKSLREPVARQKRLQMQKLYDRMRSEEEGESRVVLYVRDENMEALAPYDLGKA